MIRIKKGRDWYVCYANDVLLDVLKGFAKSMSRIEMSIIMRIL